MVQQDAVALRGAIKLANLRDAESRLKLLPNLRAQAVANRNAHLVRAVVLGLGRPEQVAAQLANVYAGTFGVCRRWLAAAG